MTNSTRSALDPITTEVISNQLLGIAEEMWATLIRCAYSINIKERFDCSTAVFDTRGEVIALPPTAVPGHLSSLDGVVKSVMRQFSTSDLQPGDAFVGNDPYHTGGSHLMDYTVVSPVYDLDGALIAFVANLAHHSDIGGRVPGSEAIDNKTVFEEGLRIPPLRLCKEGKPFDDIVNLLSINSRLPEERRGDILAQISANRTGILRIEELLNRYGGSQLLSHMDELLAYTERWLRDALQEIPTSSSEHEELLEHEGLMEQPIRLHLRITNTGDSLEFDFSQSSDQVPAAINVPPCGVSAVVRTVVKTMIDPILPANGGLDRVIRIITRPGSIMDPIEPAATGQRSDTCAVIGDLVAGALGKLITTESMGSSGPHHAWRIGGLFPNSRNYFIDYESFAGAHGATAYDDGFDAVRIWASGASNAPIETLEAEYPFLHHRYELIQDSGGPGKFRGGMGTRRDLQVFGSDLSITYNGFRQRLPASGRDGGLQGATGSFVLNPGTDRETALPWFGSNVPLRNGDIISVRTPGGGGYGDPTERDRSAVLRDLAERRISQSVANRVYGVKSLPP